MLVVSSGITLKLRLDPLEQSRWPKMEEGGIQEQPFAGEAASKWHNWPVDVVAFGGAILSAVKV